MTIGAEFAHTRKLPYSPCLYRATATMQRGASPSFATRAGRCGFYSGGVRKDARYIVVDDVSTTGATLEYAARTLLEAGAHEVWVCSTCYAPTRKKCWYLIKYGSTHLER